MLFRSQQAPEAPEWSVRNGRVSLSRPTIFLGVIAIVATTVSVVLLTNGAGADVAPKFMTSQGGHRAMRTRVFGEGKYDGKMWDMAAKMDVYNAWDPSQPRSDTNFNPFQRDDGGNGADASGYFPGQGKYKDPQRPAVSYASMQEDAAALKAVEENPKPGDVPGAPGSYVGLMG